MLINAIKIKQNDLFLPKTYLNNYSIQKKQNFDVFEKSVSFGAKCKNLSYEDKLLKIEKKLRKVKGHEEFYIIDEKGDAIQHRAVEGSEIYLTDEEKDLLRGKTFIHNHPNGTSISLNDFCVAYTEKAKEVRVVTKDKRYSLKIPEGMTQEQANKVATSYSNKLWIVCLNGNQTKPMASHKIWEWTAKDEKLDYTCTDW